MRSSVVAGLMLGVFVFASQSVSASQSLIAPGAVWKYLDNGTDQGTAWQQPGFNDSSWRSGAAQLGFGDGDEVTVIGSATNRPITFYFRRAFSVSQASSLSNVVVRLLRDDGGVVYLNGIEVFRSNMPNGPISYTTLAATTVGGADETSVFYSAPVDPNLLVEGVNVVAVEIHQVNATSSDISFDLGLAADGPAPVELPVVSIIATDNSASEVNSNSDRVADPGAFRITRSGPTNQALYVTYALDGTAVNGVDYARLPGFVQMAAGVTAVDVVVEILDDAEVEGTETIRMSLTGPPCPVNPPPESGCYRIGESNLAVISIADDEPANRPPTVTLASPSDGTEFTAPANITLIANGNDPDGYETLLTVQFFEGTHSLGIRTNYPTLNPVGPFVMTWENIAVGQYILTAVATDNHGAKATSAPVHITVRGETNGPVTLISMGAVWKYLDNGSDQGTAWREAAYDDSAWAAGQAQLGYGDGDERTVVSFGSQAGNKYITTYFRKSIYVANASNLTILKARLLEDDGAAVYVNGIEVLRSNLPQGPLSFNTFATVAAENQIVEASLPPGVLVSGVNVIAVEVHQVNATSSDLSFDFDLNGNGSSGSELPTVGVFSADAHASERPTNPGSTNNTADTGEFTIWRDGSTTEPLTVLFSLGGSARNGIDYETLNESAVIPVGASAIHLIVRPIDDSLVEGDETVILQLQSNAAYQFEPNLSYPPSATVVIADDDPNMTNQLPFVQINAPRNGDVFVAPTNIELVAYAQDPEDSYDVTVEFFAGDHSLGFGTFVPTRCATPYCPNFALTWTNPPVGQYSLTAKATDKSGASSFSAPVNISVQGDNSGDRELHAVGLYEGGGCSLVVNRPGKRVTLFLSSYHSVYWNIIVSDGTIVERIFLSGYYRQHVNAPAGAQVVSMAWEDGNDYIYVGYSLDSGVFYQALPRICALTGLDISSFHGSYTVPSSIPIDTIQDDERLHCNYPQPTPLSELPNLSFTLAFYDGGIPGTGRVFFRNYTLGGAENSRHLLPAPRVVADGGGQIYYGAEGQALFKIDSQTGTAELMQLPPDVPELSWPMGIAYDPTRDRVLLATLGGEGYLYGYFPSYSEWTLVSSMNNLDVDCITYHAALDRVYGTKVSHIDYGDNALYEFSADGTFLREIRLPVTPYDIGPVGYRSELVSVGDYLVLIEEREPLFASGYQLTESRMYLIDPNTGQVWLTYRRVTGEDSDGDGVPDSRDHCPNTPPGAIVNADGCSIGQLCPCEGGWQMNTEYVQCVIEQSWKFYRAGLISADERRAIIGEAAQRNCGGSDGACLVAQPQQSAEIQHDGICFVVTGATGTCVLECSADLVNWRPIQTITIPNTTMEVADTTAGLDGARFYRLRMQ